MHLFKAKPSFPCNRIIVRECLSSSLFLQIPLAANPFLYSSNVRSKKSAGLRVGLRQRITIEPSIKIEDKAVYHNNQHVGVRFKKTLY